MTFGCELSSAAEADPRDIIRYTQKQWGIAQTRPYVAKIQDSVERMAKGHDAVKDVSGLYPGPGDGPLRTPLFFCLPRKDAPALVVAIFHARTDLMVRLADR